MTKNLKVLVLNLPSPPYQEIDRDWAGGFGTAAPCNRNHYGHSSKPSLHPFLPYVSSTLSEAGFEIKILDCQKLKLNQFQFLKNVKGENPDVVVSLVGFSSLEKDLELLSKVKESLQNVFVICVGTVCRVIPEKVLLNSNVDVFLRNSYPYTSNLVDLIQAFQQSRTLKSVPGVSYVKCGKIIKTPESHDLDLGEISSPLYDSLELEGYDDFVDATGERYPCIRILGSKGCPYQCSYCPYPIGFGKKWTSRSPKEIVNEMEYLRNVRNIKGFLFRDQSFMFNKKHATEICTEIIQRKLDIAWYCEVRVNEVSRGILNLMKKAGCKRVQYGVETGDSEILKMAKPGVQLVTMKKAFRVTREIGLLTNAHVILGWPDDNKETIEKTSKFLLSLKPDRINLNFLTPYPQTKMYELARRDSLIVNNNWSNYTSHTVVMKTKHLSPVQVNAANKKFINDFSKQRLKQLFLQLNTHTVKRPDLFFNSAKELVRNMISP